MTLLVPGSSFFESEKKTTSPLTAILGAKSMQCTNPIEIVDSTFIKCKRCINCRIDKSREWAGKIVLEMNEIQSKTTFLTLTYDDAHVPFTPEYVQNLKPNHLFDFMNRLRKHQIINRYFAVGEYGDESKRPHFHLMLFNTDPIRVERASQALWYEKGDKNKTPMGFIQAREANSERARYIAGYCVKKMTKTDDPRLDGREPEFSVFSKQPPIGKAGMNRILDMLCSRTGARAIAAKGGILPSSFNMHGKNYPFSKYWKDWLYEKMDMVPPELCDFREWEFNMPGEQIELRRFRREQARIRAEQKESLRLSGYKHSTKTKRI
jgi:hypothetical protein